MAVPNRLMGEEEQTTSRHFSGTARAPFVNNMAISCEWGRMRLTFSRFYAWHYPCQVSFSKGVSRKGKLAESVKCFKEHFFHAEVCICSENPRTESTVQLEAGRFPVQTRTENFSFYRTALSISPVSGGLTLDRLYGYWKQWLVTCACCAQASVLAF